MDMPFQQCRNSFGQSPLVPHSNKGPGNVKAFTARPSD